MRTKNRARRAIIVARRARDLSAKAEKSLQENCDFKHGRAEYKADSRAAGVTGPNTYLLIS